MSQQQSKIRIGWVREKNLLAFDPKDRAPNYFKVIEAAPLLERLKEISYELEFFGGNPECGCYQGKDILQDLIKELEG